MKKMRLSLVKIVGILYHIEKTLKSKYHTPTHIQYNYTQRDIHSWNQSESVKSFFFGHSLTQLRLFSHN